MQRIFASLSLFAIGLLVTDLMLGLTGPDYNGLSAEFREQVAAEADGRQGETPVDRDETLPARWTAAQSRVRLHMLIGILAALVTVLVQSVGVTYFIGTGRWCKEVIETYDLDAGRLMEANRIKRRSFPWAMLGIATVLAITMCGAAADPGTLGDNTQAWVQPHRWLAIVGTIVIAICLRFQARSIARNQANVESIMAEVRRVREARGLEVEPVQR